MIDLTQIIKIRRALINMRDDLFDMTNNEMHIRTQLIINECDNVIDNAIKEHNEKVNNDK